MKLNLLSAILSAVTIFIYNEASAGKQFPIKSAVANEVRTLPKIDANTDQYEYSIENPLSGFVNTNGQVGHVDDETYSIASYDDEFFYITVSTPRPVSTHDSRAVQHDDRMIFYDDRVEVFIDANHDHRSYYNLVINTGGQQFDQEVFQPLPGTRTHFKDSDWNAFWKAESKIIEDRWVVEMAVSLESLGLKGMVKGTTIGFNVGLVKDSRATPGEDARKFTVEAPTQYLAWSFVKDGIWETISNFNAPHMFGDLTFGQTDTRVVNISFPQASFQRKLGKPSLQGYNTLEIALTEPHPNLKMILEVSVPDSGEQFRNAPSEKVTWRYQQDVSSTNLIKSRYYLSDDQENKLTIKLINGETNDHVYTTSYTHIVPPFLSFDLEPFYDRSAQSGSVKCYKNFESLSCIDCKLKIQLVSPDEVLDELVIEEFEKASEAFTLFESLDIGRLSAGNYEIKSEIIAENKTLHSFIQPFTKVPTKAAQEKFEVTREEYSYGGLTDEAVVVKFPNRARFVFWKLAGYVPWWDIDQAIMSNEFVEAWGGGIEGCAEPLQDREGRYSTVEILVNTPAMVKVKWRYALNDAHYKIYANEWVEEFYTFYPDGTGVREVNLYANTDTEHEVFEAIYVNPPQVSTYQLFDEEVASVRNLSGDKYTVHQLQDRQLYKEVLGRNNLIFETHFKDRLNPFTVLALGDSSILPGIMYDRIFLAKWLAPEGSRRAHWPASRYAVDGYNAVADDMPGHFNLGSIHVMSERDVVPNKWLFLIGLKDEYEQDDMAMAKGWLDPSKLKHVSGVVKSVYDRAERAYVIQTKHKSKKMSFQPMGDILNPVLSFESDKSEIRSISIDNKKIGQSDYSVSNIDGRCVVFLNFRLLSGSDLTIKW